MTIQKLKLIEIGQKLNFENWDSIKEEFNKLTKFPGEKKDTLLFAKEIYSTKLKIKLLIPKKIEFFTKNVNNWKLYFYNLDGIEHAASSLYAQFECLECLKLFKVEYNPARCKLDSFLCRKCKKSVLHKCNDYKKNYEQSMLKIYGVKRPLQSVKIHKKFTDTMQLKYGVSYSAQNPESLNKTRCNSYLNGKSKVEIEFGKLLIEKLGSDRVDSNNPKIKIAEKRWLNPDFIVDDKIVIEFYGDYWHGNPLLYSSEDIVSNCYKASEIWELDNKRIEEIKSAGYTVYIIWEYDWKKNKFSTLENLIKCVNSF